MAIISSIKLPSGNTYEIADAYARQLIAGGIQFIISWDGNSTPVVANIPAGVTVTYNETEYTGTLPAASAQPMSFYLVKEVNEVYGEYVVGRTGSGTTLDPYVYSWEKLGDTSIDLSTLGNLAYKDNVTLNKQTATALTGVQITSQPTITAGTPTTDSVLGADTTFAVTQPTISVTPATASIYAPTVTNNAPNVPNWAFELGTGADAETLIISGGNGSFASNTVATGITSATASGTAVSANTNDQVSAVTGMPTITASGTEVGSNGTATVLTNSTSISVS